MPAPPPFDPELAVVLQHLAPRVPPTMDAAVVARLRETAPDATVGGLVAALGLRHDEVTVVCDGGRIEVSVFRAAGTGAAGPGIVYLHGGGMVFGNRFGGVQAYLPFVADHNAVVVAVGYRLAPEHPHPTPVEDCYAAVRWTAENAARLGIDPARLVVAGQSAGAGLAAGVCLLARARGGPALDAQVLISPMLDDRVSTMSAHQIDGIGVWDRASDILGWNALLGDSRGGPDVPESAAPGRAHDLSGLPAAYISAGSCEVFRDEAVAYAGRIWACGGDAELHVWPGAFHGFENFAPTAQVSVAAIEMRDRWLLRRLTR